MLHTVKKVEYINGYKLKLIFNDGKTKIIDFESRLETAKNMFLPLKDVDFFKKVKSDGTTLVWPNGLDLCPDVLYSLGKDIVKTTNTGIRRKKRSSTTISKRTQKPSVSSKS